MACLGNFAGFPKTLICPVFFNSVPVLCLITWCWRNNWISTNFTVQKFILFVSNSSFGPVGRAYDISRELLVWSLCTNCVRCGLVIVLISFMDCWLKTRLTASNATTIYILLLLYICAFYVCYFQQAVQTCLVVLAVVCALWMLLSKPLILRHRHNKRLNSEVNRSTTCFVFRRWADYCMVGIC